MSFIDLATITMHRRNELEGRINQLSEKCDHAISEIKKLKTKAQGFVLHLNCEPSELKECFLKSMKQLDEYMYLMTDFNLATAQIEDISSSDNTPVLDTSHKMPSSQLGVFNLLDALSESQPSTSRTCTTFQPPEKPKRVKTPKQEQTLIEFSSTSCSSESVPKSDVAVNEVHCNIVEEMDTLSLKDSRTLPPQTSEPCKLPAQNMLEVDYSYTGTIMHIDGAYFWVITDEIANVYGLMTQMTEHYMNNHTDLSPEEVQALAYCAFLDDDCYYRGLFLNLTTDDTNIVEVFLVDTGETRCAHISNVQPLAEQFYEKPPFARCCHLAGVDLLCYNDKHLMERFEEFMMKFIGILCNIEVDDNSSESLGVYVVLSNKDVLNEVIVREGLAHATDRSIQETPPTDVALEVPQELDITQCPEYEDPVEAVTGYHNRDEADICKHYKGGPEKTCFKGARCTKKHVVKHPDGWTLDRVEVPAKCKSLPLPKPGTWHKVLVSCVCHFDKVYLQFSKNNSEKEKLPDFGVVLPPTTLPSLVRDMNSAAAKQAYKPLKMSPAPGELVAALYPLDNNWYRARVLSLTRSDQNVEVLYVDYGTTLWVKEDQVRVLEMQYTLLPYQAVRCVLAGVVMQSHCSQDWATAKKSLSDLVQDHVVEAHIVARNYDELVVELYDKNGYSLAEQLTALDFVELTHYEVQHDTNVPHKIVIP